jgi:hypothetical protein
MNDDTQQPRSDVLWNLSRYKVYRCMRETNDDVSCNGFVMVGVGDVDFV